MNQPKRQRESEKKEHSKKKLKVGRPTTRVVENSDPDEYVPVSTRYENNFLCEPCNRFYVDNKGETVLRRCKVSFECFF